MCISWVPHVSDADRVTWFITRMCSGAVTRARAVKMGVLVTNESRIESSLFLKNGGTPTHIQDTRTHTNTLTNTHTLTHVHTRSHILAPHTHMLWTSRPKFLKNGSTLHTFVTHAHTHTNTHTYEHTQMSRTSLESNRTFFFEKLLTLLHTYI